MGYVDSAGMSKAAPNRQLEQGRQIKFGGGLQLGRLGNEKVGQAFQLLESLAYFSLPSSPEPKPVKLMDSVGQAVRLNYCREGS